MSGAGLNLQPVVLVSEGARTVAGEGPKSSFGRNTALMVFGTLVAQGLMLAALPVLTRLYPPEAIGLQAIFVAVAGPLVVLATLRLDLALVLPKSPSEARTLLSLAFYQAVALSSVIAVVLILFHNVVSSFLAPEVGSSLWLWWLLPMLTFGALFQCGMSFATRTSAFKHVVLANLALSIAFVLTAVTMGALSPNVDGLVLSRVVAQFAGVATLFGLGHLFTRWLPVRLSWSVALQHWRNRRQFLVFNTPYSLVGGLARDLPIFVFAAGLSAGAAASYALARTVTLAPMTLVSSAMSRVFYKEAVDRIGTPSLEVLARRLTSLGLFVGLPVFAWLAVWGDQVFMIVFGNEWTSAGTMSQLLSFPLWLALQTGWPERLFEVTSRQGVSFAVQVLFDLLHVITILVVFFSTRDALYAVAAFAVTYSLYQLTYLMAVYRVAGFSTTALASALARSALGFAVCAGVFAMVRHLAGAGSHVGLMTSAGGALLMASATAVILERRSKTLS